MRILLRTLVCLAVAFSPAIYKPIFAQSLTARVEATLGDPSLKTAKVGIAIVEMTPAGVETLYTRNATLPLVPASNTKLVTTAAAFEKYGPNAQFKTLLYQAGEDLILVGGGDPALGDAKLAEQKGGTPTTVFEAWAGRLVKVGLTKYRHLIVDDSVFDHAFVHPNWPRDQLLTWYSAPIAGLNFNANCLDWTPLLTSDGVGIQLMPDTTYVSVAIKAHRGGEQRVWLWRPEDSNAFEMRGTVRSSGNVPESVTINDPGLWTATVLRDTLAAHGVVSYGQISRGAVGAYAAAKPRLVAYYQSPLLDAIHRANTNSLNMMAEGICKRLGHDATGQPGDWTNGPAAVTAYALGLGIPQEQITLDDGSGLSNKNRVSALAFATILAHVAGRTDGPQFVETLAQPGRDGTLERRFKGLACAAFVHGKTGHISGVSTLSGYLTVGERRFAFSLLVNHHQGNANPWQDHVVNALYEWALR